jgi:predicted nucleic acid-binding protein
LAVRVYLNTSALVPLIIEDALSQRARAILIPTAPTLVVSDFALAEFASAIARLLRIRSIGEATARAAFAAVDLFVARMAERVETSSADVRTAESFLRRLDLTLRAPDAIQIALAQRTRAALATFDEKMAAAAVALKAELALI